MSKTTSKATINCNVRPNLMYAYCALGFRLTVLQPIMNITRHLRPDEKLIHLCNEEIEIIVYIRLELRCVSVSMNEH